MSYHVQVPNQTQLGEKSQAILSQLKQKLGMVPNLYAVLGYADEVLENYLSFSSAAGHGTFNAKEIEAIKLAVSEVNQCAYCLAAHTALGKMAGLTEEETLDIRAGQISDRRLNILARTAADLAHSRGKLSDSVRTVFFEEGGFTESDLVQLIAVVTAVTFTNYLFGATEIPIDFPQAKSLAIADV